jgi:hypothetical protein
LGSPAQSKGIKPLSIFAFLSQNIGNCKFEKKRTKTTFLAVVDEHNGIQKINKIIYIFIERSFGFEE